MTTHDPLHGVDIEALPPDQRIAAATLAELRTLRRVVVEERRGRRLSVRLSAIAAVAVVAVLGYFIRSDSVDDARFSRVTCEERAETREQIREAQLAGYDYLADFFEVDPETKAEAIAGAEVVVRRVLPPPDC